MYTSPRTATCLVAVLGSLLLAACGGGGDDDTLAAQPVISDEALRLRRMDLPAAPGTGITSDESSATGAGTAASATAS